MAKKNLSKRLTNQHKESKGVVGIFGDEGYCPKKVCKVNFYYI
ncbi:MAG: hypothetical protein BWX59_01761 [Bacteroidetes bacterium ADurb.Bin028]|jgi:hypothetical protein|nr:MAG: hypothetical protein BWX59_01761 [Bacteroidetes bacterium ADurb.Bin028]